MSFNPFAKNDGLWLERLLDVTHRAYLDTGIAKIEKVAPPICYVGKGKGIVALRNPFVDYIGTARGRGVCMEAKSTDSESLSLLSDGGITKRQWAVLVDWERAGNMCGVVWGRQTELRFLSMKSMKDVLANGAKTVKWGIAEKIAQGEGFVLNDWLLNMRDAYGYPKADTLKT